VTAVTKRSGQPTIRQRFACPPRLSSPFFSQMIKNTKIDSNIRTAILCTVLTSRIHEHTLPTQFLFLVSLLLSSLPFFSCSCLLTCALCVCLRVCLAVCPLCSRFLFQRCRDECGVEPGRHFAGDRGRGRRDQAVLAHGQPALQAGAVRAGRVLRGVGAGTKRGPLCVRQIPHCQTTRGLGQGRQGQKKNDSHAQAIHMRWGQGCAAPGCWWA